ncbi:MAG TPA: 2-phospho-L-lactate guanylyltransferase [Candidatus Limnocylindria bacterium]|nr:2-phospho-L-lactate guanylyltransferase [Candidatus Limnocylindria bacterium]
MTDPPTIVVLARDVRRAKSRLRARLAPAQRERLALAMFDDVVAAARSTRWPVLVVTDSAPLAARARAAGARAMRSPARGTRAGARAGVRTAERDGTTAVLILASDVPLVRAAELRRIAAAGARSAVVIVPDRSRVGTNALYLRPPSRIAPRFGRDSFAAHRAAAGAQGRTLTVAGLALDVDTPDDLDALRRSRRKAGPRTRAVLGSA